MNKKKLSGDPPRESPRGFAQGVPQGDALRKSLQEMTPGNHNRGPRKEPRKEVDESDQIEFSAATAGHGRTAAGLQENEWTPSKTSMPVLYVPVWPRQLKSNGRVVPFLRRGHPQAAHNRRSSSLALSQKARRERDEERRRAAPVEACPASRPRSGGDSYDVDRFPTVPPSVASQRKAKGDFRLEAERL